MFLLFYSSGAINSAFLNCFLFYGGTRFFSVLVVFVYKFLKLFSCCGTRNSFLSLSNGVTVKFGYLLISKSQNQIVFLKISFCWQNKWLLITHIVELEVVFFSCSWTRAYLYSFSLSLLVVDLDSLVLFVCSLLE